MSVLIIGAGPAGAATALLLARAGIEVTLVEREGDFERVFRGEALMPSGLDALLQMGLGELLRSLPGRVLESWDLHIEGEPIFVVHEPVAALGDRAVRIVPQPALLEALVGAAARHPGFRFERSTTLRELRRENGRVVGARLDGADGAREVRASFVVGCDGRASMTRKLAGLELRLSREHYDVLWFRLPAPQRLRDRSSFLMFASRTRVAACYTSWDGQLRFAMMLPKGSYRAVRHADWAEELALPLPAWLAEHVRAERARIEGPVVLDVIVGRCPSWTAPGLLLIGDAAHPMSPVRAQGINLALRDAIVVANHLVPVLREGAGPAALDTAAGVVQAEREPEIRRAQSLQARDTRGIASPAAPLILAIARRAGRWLGRFEWAERAWLRQQHDLRFGSTEVRLRV